MAREEQVEGFVVDIACLRKYPQRELLTRAREHSKECALMGHCVESGYGLIDEGKELHLLEPASTPQVVTAIRGSSRDRGIRLQATRKPAEDGTMRTSSVREIG